MREIQDIFFFLRNSELTFKTFAGFISESVSRECNQSGRRHDQSGRNSTFSSSTTSTSPDARRRRLVQLAIVHTTSVLPNFVPLQHGHQRLFANSRTTGPSGKFSGIICTPTLKLFPESRIHREQFATLERIPETGEN